MVTSRIKRIGLVGHCGADAFILSRFIHRAISDVPIEQINDTEKLDAIARSDSLLLINRVLDGSFSTTNGVELIRKLVQVAEPPVVTLISNHQYAQADAQDAGARPGFGKADLRDPETASRLKTYFKFASTNSNL